MFSILFFAEDPGAANVIGPVVAALPGDMEGCLLSAGYATDLLIRQGLRPRPVQNAEEAHAAFSQSRARCVVVGTSENPDSVGLDLIDTARTAGAVCVGVVDFSANAAHRFRGRSGEALAHAPDWLVVPDAWTAREYERLGYPASRIGIVGHPHYDAALEARARLDREGRSVVRSRMLPAAEHRTVIVFVSEISSGLDPAQYRRSPDYTLTGRGGAAGRTEIVVEEVLDAIGAVAGGHDGRPYLVLRRHPKENTADLSEYLASFDMVSTGGDPRPLIYAADLVVGMSSMLLMEAYLMQVPVLSILPRESERAWLPITRSGTVPCVTDRTMLRAELRTLLTTQHRRNSDEIPGVIIPATSRIIEFVRSISSPGTS